MEDALPKIWKIPKVDQNTVCSVSYQMKWVGCRWHITNSIFVCREACLTRWNQGCHQCLSCVYMSTCIWFWFHNLSRWSKYCCMLTVWLGIQGHSKYYFCNLVYCQLKRSVCQSMQFLFQTNWQWLKYHYSTEKHASKILFANKALQTIKCGGQI